MKTTRCAIVGTFNTWKHTPWNDPSLYIVGLNDAYTLGFPRANEWYELHPLDHMYFRDLKQKIVDAREVGDRYVRPKGHLEWLQKQAATIPVWLQQAPPAGWPVNARQIPLADLEAKYGAYWASGPSYELMHLYHRGFREFHIYGIHLATEHEYVEQRPNWEHLLGRLLGVEVSITEGKGIRTYSGKDVTVVLPESCPILTHGWKYAYEPKPKAPIDPDAEEWKAVQAEKKALLAVFVESTDKKARAKAKARLERLQIIELDIQQQRAKRQMCGTLACGVAA